MVEVLAGFGLAYVLVKVFVGILAESKQAGLVLVHDRRGFFKILACFVALGLSVMAVLLVVGG